MSIKALSNKTEGYYVCTRLLLERKDPHIVENQISDADSNLGPYEIKTDKLARRTDLLESNLKQLLNKLRVVVGAKLSYKIRITRLVISVFIKLATA